MDEYFLWTIRMSYPVISLFGIPLSNESNLAVLIFALRYM